jgi:hypothetical protein
VYDVDVVLLRCDAMRCDAMQCTGGRTDTETPMMKVVKMTKVSNETKVMKAMAMMDLAGGCQAAFLLRDNNEQYSVGY